ncbi:MAG: indolepyruvate ferredoxin oxidoreductase [delta proteobacterium MLS_D]|jgi:indolepyruvate ferredoxin oxidoreductase, alpha subunit|nr:MAG: indolepyruvate ferredoxin oxidoreductase [delta proteobacterium MLS_D]
MSYLTDSSEGTSRLVMGNEAIVRGALEAGVNVASGYPGTPSSEIVESFSNVASERNLYVEWSVNEKVALEVAAAASFAELRALCAMKQNGVNVASDFLLHLVGSGTRGGLVLVSCDDPGALSSVNEGESRYFARIMEMPLLEPGDFQEAKDMTRWAFDLSEELKQIVMLRSVTRMSHASGTVTFGSLPKPGGTARFKFDGFILDPDEGMIISAPVDWKHQQQQEKVKKAREIFETSRFNTYEGPERPELLLITSSACTLYSREALKVLGVEDRVGLLKLGTTWPLPPKLLSKHLASTDKVMIVEEVLPFLEENVKILAAERAAEIGIKTFYGKNDGLIPMAGELNPDLVIEALNSVLGLNYSAVSGEYEQSAQLSAFVGAPFRDQIFCPGCPHRASFFSIHNAIELDGRKGFVCGDIGCYSMAIRPTGFESLKTLHAMGSGAGVASGFGKLGQFGMDQPVLAVCGDSTFYHAVIPALVNAVHNRSNITLVVLDNSGTAMTGFQPHPGLDHNVLNEEVPAVDIAKICEAVGARVEIRDPFNLEETRRTINELMDDPRGVKVLILRQACALSPQRKHERKFTMSVDEELCLGEECGCGRFCTRIFRCPGLIWNKEKGKACIDDAICVGCGVCADICPQKAIKREEVA